MPLTATAAARSSSGSSGVATHARKRIAPSSIGGSAASIPASMPRGKRRRTQLGRAADMQQGLAAFQGAAARGARASGPASRDGDGDEDEDGSDTDDTDAVSAVDIGGAYDVVGRASHAVRHIGHPTDHAASGCPATVFPGMLDGLTMLPLPRTPGPKFDEDKQGDVGTAYGAQTAGKPLPAQTPLLTSAWPGMLDGLTMLPVPPVAGAEHYLATTASGTSSTTPLESVEPRGRNNAGRIDRGVGAPSAVPTSTRTRTRARLVKCYVCRRTASQVDLASCGECGAVCHAACLTDTNQDSFRGDPADDPGASGYGSPAVGNTAPRPRAACSPSRLRCGTCVAIAAELGISGSDSASMDSSDGESVGTGGAWDSISSASEGTDGSQSDSGDSGDSGSGGSGTAARRRRKSKAVGRQYRCLNSIEPDRSAVEEPFFGVPGVRVGRSACGLMRGACRGHVGCVLCCSRLAFGRVCTLRCALCA